MSSAMINPDYSLTQWGTLHYLPSGGWNPDYSLTQWGMLHYLPSGGWLKWRHSAVCNHPLPVLMHKQTVSAACRHTSTPAEGLLSAAPYPQWCPTELLRGTLCTSMQGSCESSLATDHSTCMSAQRLLTDAHTLYTSVRPIREFREMPITDINVQTHLITDTNIRYEGHSVAVGLLLMPYSFPPPTSPILRNWLVTLACGLPAFMRGLNGRQYTLL